LKNPDLATNLIPGKGRIFEAKQFNIKTNISQMKTRLISYGMLLKGLFKISSSKEG
jgi:hypothetical protein